MIKTSGILVFTSLQVAFMDSHPLIHAENHVSWPPPHLQISTTTTWNKWCRGGSIPITPTCLGIGQKPWYQSVHIKISWHSKMGHSLPYCMTISTDWENVEKPMDLPSKSRQIWFSSMKIHQSWIISSGFPDWIFQSREWKNGGIWGFPIDSIPIPKLPKAAMLHSLVLKLGRCWWWKRCSQTPWIDWTCADRGLHGSIESYFKKNPRCYNHNRSLFSNCHENDVWPTKIRRSSFNYLGIDQAAWFINQKELLPRLFRPFSSPDSPPIALACSAALAPHASKSREHRYLRLASKLKLLQGSSSTCQKDRKRGFWDSRMRWNCVFSLVLGSFQYPKDQNISIYLYTAVQQPRKLFSQDWHENGYKLWNNFTRLTLTQNSNGPFRIVVYCGSTPPAKYNLHGSFRPGKVAGGGRA